MTRRLYRTAPAARNPVRSVAVCLWLCIALFLSLTVAAASADQTSQPAAADSVFSLATAQLINAASAGDDKAIQSALKAGGNANEKGRNDATPLMWMIYQNDTKGFDRLLALGADPSLENNLGDSASVLAAASKNADFVQSLIQHKADLTAQATDGTTPLMRAAALGSILSVRRLIDAGVPVNTQDKKGRTALMYAVLRGDRAITRTLLNEGADPLIEDTQGLSAIRYASMSEDAELVKMLKERQSNPTPKDVFDDPLAAGLATAAAKNDIAGVEALLEKGAKPNTLGRAGLTPLIWAGIEKADKGFLRLLDAGGDPNIISSNGTSGTFVAAGFIDTQVLARVLKAGGKPDIQGPGGMTPIMYAAQQGLASNITLLVEAGHANVNAQDALGLTALHYAVLHRHKEAVAALVAHHADKTIKDQRGLTPVDVATLLKLDEMLKILNP